MPLRLKRGCLRRLLCGIGITCNSLKLLADCAHCLHNVLRPVGRIRCLGGVSGNFGRYNLPGSAMLIWRQVRNVEQVAIRVRHDNIKMAQASRRCRGTADLAAWSAAVSNIIDGYKIFAPFRTKLVWKNPQYGLAIRIGHLGCFARDYQTAKTFVGGQAHGNPRSGNRFAVLIQYARRNVYQWQSVVHDGYSSPVFT